MAAPLLVRNDGPPASASPFASSPPLPPPHPPRRRPLPLQHAATAPPPTPFLDAPLDAPLDTTAAAAAPLDHRHHASTFPALSPAPPLLTRWRRHSRVLLHRLGTPPAPSPAKSANIPAPTFTKTYPARPSLPVHVYIPPPRAIADPGPLPLYIHVAPTSFLTPEPTSKRAAQRSAAASRFCAYLASRGICVARVSFRAPPRWLYPTQIYDVVSIVQDVLAGTALPIDRRRVAMGGFGAGASVALGAVQSRELRGLVKGVFAVGGVVDWGIPGVDKVASVSWRAGTMESPEGRTPTPMPPAGEDEKRAKTKDMERRKAKQRAVKVHDLQGWAYVPPRQDLTEAMLSPAYAPRSAMPRHVFVVGAERDICGAEAEKMALRLAADEGREACDPREQTGRREMVGNEDEWNCGGVKWERVPGRGEGFVYVAEKGEAEKARQKVVEQLFDRVGDWLWARVFA